MEIKIAPNKIHKTDERILNIDDKIITLVGENGCGKSAILERVFTDYLEQNEITLISFTSGQNESFSKIFFNHLSQSKKFLIENNVDADAETEEEQRELAKQRKLNSFYFDTKWSPLLIFFATAIKHAGATRKFLRDKGLLKETESLIRDAQSLTDDTSTKIWFQLRIPLNYVRQLEGSDYRESIDSSKKSIRKSIVHRVLEKLAILFEDDYDFTYPLRARGCWLSASEAFRELGKDVNDLFTFLGHALKNSKFIYDHNITLHFKDGMQLNDLSDGEFQLLTIYAMIDLFDSPDTLFLFDEIDSHVHYKNTRRVWDFLKNIQGNLLTTTHSADSIILHKPSNIRLVSNGIIEDEQTAEHIFYRLQSLTDNETYKYKVAARFENIILVENKFDWITFLELAKRKIPDYNRNIEKIHWVKCSSGFNNIGQSFADSRKKWVDNFKNINENNAETKAIIFLCDRDLLPLNNINADGITLNGIGELPKFKNNLKPDAKVWRRREIENYLISHTLLTAHNKLDEFTQRFHVNIRAHDPSDIEPIRVLDVKPFFQQFYLKDGLARMDTYETGVDYNKLENLISQIPPEEISEDIEKMYNFIVSKIV